VSQRFADLSHLHVVLPARSISGGKARLGGALDAEERETLILGMLRHALATLRTWGVAEQVHVVSLDPALLADAADAGAHAVPQALPGIGELDGALNDAILAGRTTALQAGATAMLVLPADLPLLAVTSLERLLDAGDAALAAGSGRPVVVLAPADARRGTNALLVSPPDIIEPAFGPQSLEAHAKAAAAVEATLLLVVDPGLGFDLDTPEDVDRLGVDGLARLVDLGTSPLPPAPPEAIAADRVPAS
jgi:2-phospho-L-lactate guanylyltransferase